MGRSPRLTLTITATFAATAVLLAAPPASSAPPPGAGTRIIGGEEVKFDPTWAAGTGLCTASLIAPQWVLTAKHCVVVPTNLPTVAIGHREKAKGEKYKTAVSHLAGTADLALLQLERAVPNAQPVKLAAADPAMNSEVEIYGWGRTSENGPSSPILKTAKMKYYMDARDNAGGPALQFSRVTGSAWKGDSGGPAFFGGEQVGVASMATPGADGWYASVAANREWIRSIAGV